jgi:hypothetical protein
VISDISVTILNHVFDLGHDLVVEYRSVNQTLVLFDNASDTELDVWYFVAACLQKGRDDLLSNLVFLQAAHH